MSVSMVIDELEALTADFGAWSDAAQLDSCSTQLLSLCEKISLASKNSDEAVLSSIHKAGIRLWNSVISKRLALGANSVICARARHVACHLTFYANASEPSQTSMRKQLAMAMKAGKSWLDCNNLVLADTCFALAIECWMKLDRLLKISDISSDKIHLGSEQIQECRENMICVYVFEAEIALSQQKYELAHDYIARVRDLLVSCPQKSTFVASSCYNFGLDCYQKDLHEESQKWLRSSYEIGKQYKSKDEAESLANTLQLLAMAYLESKDGKNLQSALDAVDLSIQEKPFVKSYFLKLKVLLLLDITDDHVKQVFDDLCQCEGADVSFALQCISLIVSHERKQLGFRCVEDLAVRFVSPSDRIEIYLNKLNLLLSEREPEKAKELISRHLVTFRTGMDKDARNQLQMLLWEQASSCFESGDYNEAMHWYNCSLDFLEKGQEQRKNLAKLHRNRSACYHAMGRVEESLACARESEKFEPDSGVLQYMYFKIALAKKSDEEAARAVEKLSQMALEVKNGSEICNFICLAAQLSFEHGNRMVSELALEKVAAHVQDPKQALVALRCLARLKYTFITEETKKVQMQKLLCCVEQAWKILSSTHGDLGHDSDLIAEVQWFTKMCWNLGTLCEKLIFEMNRLFLLCYEFSTLLPSENVNLSQQKTCLLMAAASGLEFARSIMDADEKKCKLNEVLSLVRKCKDVMKSSLQNSCTKNSVDLTHELLLTYEFEAKARLGHGDVENVVDVACDLPNVQAKMFESLARVALAVPVDLRHVAIRCLSLAMKCHLEMPSVDYSQLSKTLHSLINLALQKGNSSNAESKEDAYSYYQDALKIIGGAQPGEFPDMEVVWLMTKAWNCGVYLYSAQEFVASEKWCALAIKFLTHLGDLKSAYEPHMSHVFAEMISRIQMSRLVMEVEE